MDNTTDNISLLRGTVATSRGECAPRWYESFDRRLRSSDATHAADRRSPLPGSNQDSPDPDEPL